MSISNGYEEAYREWTKSLSKEELKNLEKLGVLEPHNDYNKVSGHPASESEDPGGRAVGGMADDRTIEELLADRGYSYDEVQELIILISNHVHAEQIKKFSQALNRMTSELISAPNVRLACAGLIYALGSDSVNSLGTMAQAAKRLCVTRASVSKSTQQWRELLGSWCSRHVKSNDLRKKYSQAQSAKHWRKAKFKK